MMAGPERVDGNLRVDKGRGADVEQINLPIQDFMMIQEDLRVQVILFLDTLRLSRDNIDECYDFASFRKPEIRSDMRMGNVSGSDDRDPDHVNHLISLNWTAFLLLSQLLNFRKAEELTEPA